MIQKIKNIIIIIICILIIIAIGYAVYNYVKIRILKKQNESLKLENEVLIESNEKSIAEYRDKLLKNNTELNEYKKHYYTEKELNRKSNTELKAVIYELQNDNKDLIKMNESISIQHEVLLNKFERTNDQLKKTTEQLDKSNKELSKMNKPIGFDVYVMGGLSNLDNINTLADIHKDIMIGTDIRFNFLYNRVTLATGGYFKPYDNIGAGLKAEIAVNF